MKFRRLPYKCHRKYHERWPARVCAIQKHEVNLVCRMHLNETNYVPGNAVISIHDDVIKWKHFPRYWPFVRGIHWSPVNSSHKDQWRGPLVFSLICTWINYWVNNGEAGDLRRHRAHYNVILMLYKSIYPVLCPKLTLIYSLRGLHIRITWFSLYGIPIPLFSLYMVSICPYFLIW